MTLCYILLVDKLEDKYILGFVQNLMPPDIFLTTSTTWDWMYLVSETERTTDDSAATVVVVVVMMVIERNYLTKLKSAVFEMKNAFW